MASNYLVDGAMPRATKELRIVLVGKTGSGKSASGNTILGCESFESVMSPTSITDECSKARATVDGQDVVLIDTPGLYDTRHDVNTTCRHINQCICYASPGPHVFLIVIGLGRFTEEEMKTEQLIQELFGQAADRYSMVLFTRGDDLRGKTIEEFIGDSPELQELVDRCHGQYHVFNNNLKTGPQVSELLQKIRNIVEDNGGSHYTNEMFQEVERTIEEEKQHILKEKEAEMRIEKEQLRSEMRAEFEEKLKNLEKRREKQNTELVVKAEKQQCRLKLEKMKMEMQHRDDAARTEKELNTAQYEAEKARLKAQYERDLKEKEKALEEVQREARAKAELLANTQQKLGVTERALQEMSSRIKCSLM